MYVVVYISVLQCVCLHMYFFVYGGSMAQIKDFAYVWQALYYRYIPLTLTTFFFHTYFSESGHTTLQSKLFQHSLI